MGNIETKPPVVIVPPLFDSPPLAARYRMLETSYDVLFGKLALKWLFQDYFEKASSFNSRIMLKPIDDPHVDMIATVEAPLLPESDDGLPMNALFRWQRDLDDPNTFVDLYVSNTDPRVSNLDYGLLGLRYGSENLSFGATVMPYSSPDELPKNAWLVSKFGRLTAGVQYEPKCKFYKSNRIGDANKESNIRVSTFQLAASWQANKNLLLKGKVGPSSETAALTFKSWWKPSFAFNISATRDRKSGEVDFGFGIRVDNVKEASYQRADPNFVMLTPSKQHLAEDIEPRNFEAVPTELKPEIKRL